MKLLSPALVLLSLSLAACAPTVLPVTPVVSASAAPAATSNPLVGQALPPISFLDLAGQTRKFEDFAKKPAILAVFAHWCGHCQRELPLLQSFAKERESSVTLLPVEGSLGTRSEVEAFNKTFGIVAPTFYDPSGEVAKQLKVAAFPTVLFIDAAGTVRDVTVGNFNADLYARLITETAK